jgi:hypothetical protein
MQFFSSKADQLWERSIISINKDAKQDIFNEESMQKEEIYENEMEENQQRQMEEESIYSKVVQEEENI